jgi:malonyl-CoA O-methyltransferase
MANHGQNADGRSARVRQAFGMAADSYDEAAVLQREVNQRLLSRLDYIRLQPETVLDMGTGTGGGSLALKKRYGKTRVFALDFAFPMLLELKRRAGYWRPPQPVCARAEALPFKDAGMELIFSSLTLQWCPDLEAVFGECRRVLKPGGAFLFATLGPDTLKELRGSWAEVDETEHVNAFVDMHDIGDLLVSAGFADPVLDTERITLTYRDLMKMLRELKQLGANTVLGRRMVGLTGKRRFGAMCEAYERLYAENGVYPSTYEIVYGLAWGRDLNTKPVTFIPPETFKPRKS